MTKIDELSKIIGRVEESQDWIKEKVCTVHEDLKEISVTVLKNNINLTNHLKHHGIYTKILIGIVISSLGALVGTLIMGI